ncbi:MAG TPA: hypothetical protein VK471_05175 [Solirubrobacterales bacterium]|nr:hypothetical protein [Solirubrobacterales bacterium]
MAARLSVLLVAALSIALLPAALAAGASNSTTIVVSLKTPAFHGKLKSGKSACATGRTVKLFREKSGPDKLLGTDKSNAKTKWSIPIGKRLTSGSYYAKAPAKGSCKPAKSKVLSIG